jgi:hypothetical protein
MFMQPQVIYGTWHQVDGTCGVESFPADYFSLPEALANYSGDVWESETIRGYGARLSAPGYMDCTEWTVFASRVDAEEYLADMYDVDIAA